MIGQSAQILDQVLDLVLIDVGGLGGQVVAAQVGSNRHIVLAEICELILPFIPEFREAMAEHDKLALARNRIVHMNAVYVSVLVLDHWWLDLSFFRRLCGSRTPFAAYGPRAGGDRDAEDRGD